MDIETKRLREDFTFALGATQRLRALTGGDDVIMSVLEGGFALLAMTDHVAEPRTFATKDEVLDMLDDAEAAFWAPETTVEAQA